MSLAVFINVQNRIAVFILQRLVEPEGAFIQRDVSQIDIIIWPVIAPTNNVIRQRICSLSVLDAGFSSAPAWLMSMV